MKLFKNISRTLLFVLLFQLLSPFIISFHVYATSTSPVYSSTAVNVAWPNAASWTNLPNATGDTTTTSSVVNFSGNAKVTDSIVLNNFDFASQWITTGSVINGIEIQIEFSSNAKVADNTIQLTKDSAVWIWTNVATNTPNNSKSLRSYWSSTDLWWTTWTGTEILSSNFWIFINFTSTGGWGSHRADVFRWNITIHHTTTANNPPTDIALSNNSIDENQPSGTTIWSLSSTDLDAWDTHTYSLTCSTSWADDGSFAISWTSLNSAAVFDFETKSTYNICIKTDDGNGWTYDENFTININNLDEIAPVITLSWSTPISLLVGDTYTDAWATCIDDVDSTCTVNVWWATVDTSTLWTYVITYDAVDTVWNNAIQVTRTVNVVAGYVPVITLVWNVSETVEVLSTYNDAWSTANDTEDGDITSDIVTVNPVNTSATWSYTVTYNVDDSSNNSAIEVTRTVTVVDSTPPVLTLLWSTPINIIKNATYTDAWATANDSFEGDITSDIVVVNPVDTTTLGTYTVTYNVSDWSWNAATQVTRTVNVIAGDIPVIALVWSNPITHEVNTTYTDAWATASDAEDGNVTTDIVTVNPVDTTTLGTYTVTYDVDDSSDNSANQSTRTVNVVDTTSPVITLTGSNPINLTQWDSFSDPWATCSDNFDTNCSVIAWWDTVDTTRVGTYIIKYDAIDTSSNSAILVTRTVNVVAAALLINEVEYDTPWNEAEAEWFEIYNPTSGIVNIENWTITEAVWASSSKTYTFWDVDIPAGWYVIVTNETADFQLVYPWITPDVDLPWTQYFNLKNTPSDELELKDPSGASIDFVRWEDTAWWWDLEAINLPICRLLVADTDTDVDWSDECIPTPGAQNDFNAVPTDIALSNDNIDENNSVSATIGSLTTTDADSWDTHSYSLVAGAWDTDNWSFTISWTSLGITPVTDYETKQRYAIRIATNDGNGWIYEEEFIININDINLAPTDIALTNNTIDENNSIWDTIWVLSGTDDGEDTNTLTYALACNTPWADDADFSISWINLNAAAVYDFEAQNTYNICIRISDGVLSYDENFTININDLDEVAPVVVITPVTKLQNSSITDTTIQITDDVAVNVADVTIDASSTVTASALNCTQTSAIQVDCTISVDTSGDLVISTLDTSGNPGSDTELNYVVDTIAPNIPSVSVDTLWSFSIDSPELTFSSLDNVWVDYYTVTYSLDDGSPTGTGTLTTINPATSPIVLNLDPQEPVVHTIVVTVYDTAGNSSSTTIKFPPIITINAPTTLSNTTITDSTVTISAPTWNAITNIQLAPGTTWVSLWVCTGTGWWTVDPYISPVTCDINNISDSWTITVTADDNIILASGINSQSYIIDTTPPVVSITAPTKLDNAAITDTTIVVTDDTAIDVADVSVAWSSTVTSSSFSCSQKSPSRVDCTIQIDDSWDFSISADDLAGNNDTETEPNYIVDTTPPVISLIAPSPEIVEYLSSYTDGLAEFSDNVDGTGSIVWAWSVNTGILWAYVLSYDYTDTAWNPATQVTRTVNVVDTTPPVITLTWNAVENVEVNTSYTDAWATAVDNFDGNLTSAIVTADNIDITTVGSYTVTYDVTDTNTNVATQVTRTVNVVDTTPPVISLTGLNEVVLEVGTPYTEPWATATDNFDTIAPATITIDGSAVDVNTVGSYDVTYNVSDSSGNAAIEVVRTVTIEDTTIPVITLTGNAVEIVEVNTSYTDAWATANDNFDGIISWNITTVNPVDITTLWTYTITYDVIDSSSNPATQVTRTVNVVDTTIPVITLTGNAIETVEVNTSYIDAWATCSDNYDISCTTTDVNPVDITTIGSYQVTYNVIDTAGNPATEVTRTVNVVDTTPPVINLIGSTPLTIYKNATYTEFGATCTDNYDASCSVIVWWDEVDTSVLGTYTVSYDVTDANTNSATQVTRTVNVVAWDIPLISLTWNAIETVQVNGSYFDAWATASDTEDGNITSNIVTVNPVDTTTLGSYTVTYDVTDSSWNTAIQVTRTVHVVDTTPPVINLTGLSPLNIFKNTTYTEFGATCVDNYDTSCTVIVWWDAVDTSTLGTYTVSYNVTDASWNTATEVTRIINVLAGDLPVITLIWSWTITHDVNTTYTDPGATANDVEDWIITSSIVLVNNVDTSTLWAYTVTYNVIDSAWNAATEIVRDVNIIDTISPMITLSGNPTETINLWDTYLDAGATCTDNYDSTCTVTTTNTVDSNTLWSYIIVYNSVDGSGNTSIPVSRLVNVVSGWTPVITLSGNPTETIIIGSTYIDAWATASDTEDGDITSDVVTVNPVNTSTLWTYTVTYNVIDSNSNSAITLTRTVIVSSWDMPTIALNGSSTSTIYVWWNTYTELWATASDTEDEDITSDIVISWSVNTSSPWTYIISYDVVDSDGNIATTVERTVLVKSRSKDSDNDGLPDFAEERIWTNPSITDTDGDGNDDSNNDLDNVSPLVELWAINDGDGNNDGQLDAVQNSVSSLPNVENAGYNTLEISNPWDSCDQIQFFASKEESTLATQDPDFLYDLWLWDFEIGCDTPWSTANIQIYLDTTYDTSAWTYRKYNEVSETYTDISSIVSYTTETVGSTSVTVINYSITDGSIYDEDWLANGIIIDPSGPSIPWNLSTAGWWTGTTYCRDPEALNYRIAGKADNKKCIYEEDDTDEEVEGNLVILEDPIIENIDLDTTQGITPVIPAPLPTEVIEVVVKKDQDYTLKNDFDSCPIIRDINDPWYAYQHHGVFTDEYQFKYRDNIMKFRQIGIVDGYEDNSFRPARQMTRTEFLKVALISHCYTYRQLWATTEYTDVDSGTWQARVIEKAESLWMINGDISETWAKIFRPNDIITKAEAVKILMRLSLIQATNPEALGYTDITVDWHEKYIQTGQTLWLFTPAETNNRFNPDGWVSREDMVDLISNLVDLYQ